MAKEQLDGHEDLIDSVIYEKPELGVQYRLCISEFRGRRYLSVREWFQDFEGEWCPTKNGFTMPYELDSTRKLTRSLIDLLSNAEVLELVLKEEE